MELKDGQIKTKDQEQNKTIIFLEELRHNSLNKSQEFLKTQLKNKSFKILEKKSLQEELEELQESVKNSKLQMITTQNH